MNRLFFLLCVFGFSIGSNSVSAQIATSKTMPAAEGLQNQQLLVVVSGGWDSLLGEIYCFEKKQAKWVLVFSNTVVLGSKGLGTGEGLFPIPITGAPVKKEGDLKSPAGIFSIGTAFGYAPAKDAIWIQNPYICVTDTIICVDDPQSTHYNTLIKKNKYQKDWDSFEEMYRKDDYYKWGLFINHNAEKPIAGMGSCIFMHIWENDHTGTTGCTAMSEDNLLRLLHWINGRKSPLLIQLPASEYSRQVAKFHFPVIPVKEIPRHKTE